MKVDNSIIEKIQKLLALANSPNEHEAKAATARANALLIKYNLSLQQVEDHESEYVVDKVASSGYTLKPHWNNLIHLLQKYFFVKIVILKTFDGYSSGEYAYEKSARTRYKKTFQILGTKENAQIANYIFHYLDRVYPELWKDVYERNANLKPNDKQSYFDGLTEGISILLEETKMRVEEEYGLVLVKDPKLQKFVEENSNGKYGSGGGSDNFNKELYDKGVQDGKGVTLRKPIEAERSQNNTTKLIKST